MSCPSRKAWFDQDVGVRRDAELIFPNVASSRRNTKLLSFGEEAGEDEVEAESAKKNMVRPDCEFLSSLLTPALPSLRGAD